MAIVDNGIFIRNAVLNHDVSDKTIRKIKRLVSDKNPMPITHAPIGTIALAALDVLGIQPYNNRKYRNPDSPTKLISNLY